MALSPKLAVKKKAALVLLIISLIAPCIIKFQPSKADPKTITVPDDYPTITSAIGNATAGDTSYIMEANRQDGYLIMAPFDVDSVTVELPEWASPSPSPSPTPTATSTPIDMKPLPTTLLVAVAILACVFGFGLIVNLVAGKKKEKPSRVRLV
jgi:hypothetical protein